MACRDAMAIIFLAAVFYPLGTGVGDFFNVIGMQQLYFRSIATVSGLLVFTLLQGGTYINRFGTTRAN